MTGMIAQLLAWPPLGVALLVFGFAPGVALRLIVLFYRRDNPRRRELLGELYGVPRIERPFWVAEQLEVAIFEGLSDRLRAWRAGWTEWMVGQAAARIERALGMDGRKGITIARLTSDDPFASLLANDVARGWRGRGWRGAQPDKPPE
jgi:hypothetical protein